MRVFALLVALSLPALLVAAPVPKEKEKRPLYFPVTKGTKSVTASKLGKATTETTETVTKVEEKDGVFTVTVESDSGGGSTSERTFDVSDKGVFLRSIGKVVRKEPTPLIKHGGKPGDTWAGGTQVIQPGKGVVTLDSTLTLGKEEEVTVAAGKYTAIRVEEEMPTERGPASKTSSWCAPGVGLVKRVSTFAGRETTLELKEFTPGKEDKKGEKKVKDTEAIVGKWQFTAVDLGMELPEEAKKKLGENYFTFSADGKVVIWLSQDKRETEGTYAIDPSASPKTLDMSMKDDKEKRLALYELDGDTLKVCLTNSDGNPRPEKMASDVKKYTAVVTMKRVKDEKKEEKKDK